MARVARRVGGAIRKVKWNPADHPRNPANGRFIRKGSAPGGAGASGGGRDRGGSPGWADRVSGQMGGETSKPTYRSVGSVTHTGGGMYQAINPRGYSQTFDRATDANEFAEIDQPTYRSVGSVTPTGDGRYKAINPRGYSQTFDSEANANRFAENDKSPSQAGPDDAAIRDAYGALVSGEAAQIAPEQLDPLLKSLTGGGDEAKSANLAHLDVGGYGTLFATDKPGSLDRSKMPQLGTNAEEMQPFLSALQQQGVTVRVAEIDPTTLKPSQNEISGAKTGKLAGFMAEGGWLEGGLLVTSNDGYVVDGHHRWSAAAAVRASGLRPDMNVTGLVVDRPIDEVLQLAAGVASFESLEFERGA